MLAVNEPTVVLASADAKFLGPVVAGAGSKPKPPSSEAKAGGAGSRSWCAETARR
jgi:hypothetical protein